jgi:hypothetical protein
MVKLPIIFVMLGFQFLGAPPDPGWFLMGAYASGLTLTFASPV